MDTAGTNELILIVEDEKKISDIVRAYLQKEGFRVRTAHTGAEALSSLKEKPDLVILDLMLPDMQGEELCSLIRQGPDVPVIMLTAKSAEEDRVRGFTLGADDYMVKPFSPRELVVRVKARLKRTGRTWKKLRNFNQGRLRIDKDRHEVLRDGSPLHLTLTEFRILTCLADNNGRILSRNQIVNLVQGFDFEGYDRTIDAHVKNLRRKLEKDPRNPEFIQTVYGVGYRFIGTPDAE
jgi:DNA-binding response OmpR family regulator